MYAESEGIHGERSQASHLSEHDAHKTLSRTATLAALAALGSGYSKLGDAVTTAIVALALAALAISLSLVECLLGPAGSKQTGESARFLLPT